MGLLWFEHTLGWQTQTEIIHLENHLNLLTLLYKGGMRGIVVPQSQQLTDIWNLLGSKRRCWPLWSNIGTGFWSRCNLDVYRIAWSTLRCIYAFYQWYIFYDFSYQVKNQTIKMWLRWRLLAINLGVQQKCCVGFRVHMASSTTLKALEDYGRQLVDDFRILAENNSFTISCQVENTHKEVVQIIVNVHTEHERGRIKPRWIYQNDGEREEWRVDTSPWEWRKRTANDSKNTTSSVKLLNWRQSRASQGRKLSIWSYPWVTDFIKSSSQRLFIQVGKNVMLIC